MTFDQIPVGAMFRDAKWKDQAEVYVKTGSSVVYCVASKSWYKFPPAASFPGDTYYLVHDDTFDETEKVPNLWVSNNPNTSVYVGHDLNCRITEVGKVEVNEKGGKQCHTGTAFDEVPPKAITKVAEVLRVGRDKYGSGNWRAIPVKDHLDHAIRHIYLHLQGDTSEDHLTNASCRILFASELSR